MTARTEVRTADPRARLGIPLLFLLAGFLGKLGFTVNTWFMAMPYRELRVGPTLATYAINLGLILAIWILARLKASRPTVIALSVLLAMLAVAGFTGASAIWKVLVAQDLSWAGWTWQTRAIFGLNLFIGASAVWGLLRLAPWQLLRGADEPVSPATRRTQKLFGLSGLVGVAAVMVLMLGTRGDGSNPVWSNSQDVSVVIAIVAITIWLVSIALAWWWYSSADEHERRSNDVGFLAGGGLFMAATPVWWILARSGLVPPPDAMVLWYATMVVMGVGWAWHRNR